MSQSTVYPRRMPAPFDPVTTTFDCRGTPWRITVKRYWQIAVPEQNDPDTLVWNAERGTRIPYAGGCHIDWNPVNGDDVPKTVAVKASEFFRQVTQAAGTTQPLDLFS